MIGVDDDDGLLQRWPNRFADPRVDTSQRLTKKPSFSRMSRSLRALPSSAIIRRAFWPRKLTMGR